MTRGKFITFEGIEGSGKSTQMNSLAEWLIAGGHPVLTTREPGGTAIGAEIRKILLSEKTKGLIPVSETALYLADRFQHIREVIIPALKAGNIVLCDRYHDSTIAYQGYARELSIEWLDAVWRGSNLAFEPDVTILLDLDPETGIVRSLNKLRKHGMDESRFEREGIDFHTRVRNGFLELAKLHSHRYIVLDALQSQERLQSQIQARIRERLQI